MSVRALKLPVNETSTVVVGAPKSARILALLDAERVVLDFEGGKGPTIAPCVTALGIMELRRAVALRQVALVVFEQENPLRPIVVALEDRDDSDSNDAKATPDTEPSLFDLKVDGKRLRVEAHEEMVLRCGKASISLLKNGKIVIRGAYVETHASGTNRIKGAQVRIN